MDYQDLEYKIGNLSRKIDQSQSFLSFTSSHDWDSIFELCNEINGAFKSVRYPSKSHRDIAWQNFFSLRNRAYNTKKQQAFGLSEKHYDEIMRRLDNADYHAITDFVFGKIATFGLLQETKDEMKAKGKALGSIGGYFKSVKHEMIGDHKIKVHERMIEIRQHHDSFWGEHKSYQEDKKRLYEEKQRVWLEKQERGRQIKQQIENNLEGNKTKLYNAKDALDRFERKRRDLRNQIYESRNDNWRSKAEGWVYELDDKIRSIEDQIRRIESWIEEDRGKLRNWK